MKALPARQELAVLTEVSGALAEAGLDLPVLLDTITDLLAAHVGDLALVYLLGDDGVTLELVALSCHDPLMSELAEATLGGRARRADDPGPIGACFATAQPVLVNDVDPETVRAQVPEHYHELVARYPTHSLYYVPVSYRGEQLGVLSVARYLTPHGFDDDELDLVCDVVELASASVANALAHERLAEATALFETAFAHAPIGMAIHSGGTGNSRFIRVNAALCEIVGRPEVDLVGTAVADLVDASDRAEVDDLLALVAAGELEEYSDDLLLDRPDGTAVPVWVDARAVRASGDDVLILSQVQPLAQHAGEGTDAQR